MSNYTSGPLMYDGNGRIDAVNFRIPTGHICEDGSEYVGGLVALPYECGDGRYEANARRLVACWNACRGLATESLEPASVVTRKDLDAMRAQRDELLDALQGALKALDAIGDEMTVGERYTNAGQYLIDALPPARAAIAKALGEVEQAEQIAEAA